MIGFLTNAVKGIGGLVTTAGETFGKVEGAWVALTSDVDDDGKPEYKNIAEGLVKFFAKLRTLSVPLKMIGDIVGDSFGVLSKEVYPHVKNMFLAARKAGLARAAADAKVKAAAEATANKEAKK